MLAKEFRVDFGPLLEHLAVLANEFRVDFVPFRLIFENLACSFFRKNKAEKPATKSMTKKVPNQRIFGFRKAGVQADIIQSRFGATFGA